jgi:hypothetical protein
MNGQKNLLLCYLKAGSAKGGKIGLRMHLLRISIKKML